MRDRIVSETEREREGGLLPLALAGCGARPTSAQEGGCGAAGLGQLGSAQDEGEGGLLRAR